MAKKQSENFLEKIPVRVEKYRWSEKDDGLITIEIDNKGFFNRLLQLIAKKPKVSYIHLESTGSFVWKQIDGKRDILAIGELVKEHFGKDAEPVYERLVKYFATLSNAGFVEFK